ncbi:carboxylic ester hydrolase [Tistrella bauzanensis]|uniref:Carboxylic ester hydrolase n=1 Tax=Tistrella bauzanensis TaxID=657419 RepID=A0ABQ1J3D0_9PROT|nr:carboxylic ester hydrolase [Tistrella bauzanensis]
MRIFRRLRYAMAPTGSRRFAVPEPVAPWDEPVDCTEDAVIPPQHPSRLENVMGAYPAPQDEDCLHLDIWSPITADGSTPVLVFLHGGAFMTGGGSMTCYDGAILARETGLIVITVSYRLGALGFLPVDGIAPANLALRDQIAAIGFIRRIAPGMGGDGDAITLIGQSAGAYTIALMLTMPDVRPLFARAVMMSAPLGLTLPRMADMAPMAGCFLSALGVAPGDRAAVCALPVARILAAQLDLVRAAAMTPGNIAPPFGPVIDDDLVIGDPVAIMRAGGAGAQDLMLGTTREEMAAFYVDNPALSGAAPQVVEAAFARRFGAGAADALTAAAAHRAPACPLALLGDLEGDLLFTAPTRDAARAHTDHGGRAYLYSFDWQSPRPDIGACHCLDLPFLFGTWDVMSGAPMLAGAAADEIAHLGHIFRMTIGAFARNGTPDRPGLPHWPAFGPAATTLHVDRKITVTCDVPMTTPA